MKADQPTEELWNGTNDALAYYLQSLNPGDPSLDQKEVDGLLNTYLNQIEQTELELLNQPYGQTDTIRFSSTTSSDTLQKAEADREKERKKAKAEREKERRRRTFQVKPKRQDFKIAEDYKKALKIYQVFREHESERGQEYRARRRLTKSQPSQ